MKVICRILVIAALLLPASTQLYAQAPDVEWSRVYGGENSDLIYAMDICADGYVIAGKTTSFGSGNADLYVLKTNLNGDSLWMTVWGSSRQEHTHDVVACSGGGYAVVGIERIVQDYQPQIVFHRLNSARVITATRNYGTIGKDDEWSVSENSDGGFIIAGQTDVYDAANDDVYVIRTDGAGDTLWTRVYGGADHDAGYHAAQTFEGGFVIVGGTSSPSGGSEWDVYLVRTAANGDTLWTKHYGGSQYDVGYYVYQTSDNGFIVAGETRSYGEGEADLYLIKTDLAGNVLWARTHGGLLDDVGRSVQFANNGYTAVGYTSSFGTGFEDMYVVRTNLAGDTLWTRTIGWSGYDRGYDIEPTADGGYVAAGYNDSWAGGDNAWLVKLDTDPTGVVSRVPAARLKISVQPNPFAASTTVSYRLPAAAHVKVSVYDAAGRMVVLLHDGIQSADEHTLVWEARNLPSGVYFVRVQALRQSYSIKTVLLK